jgi:hypothetical protein
MASTRSFLLLDYAGAPMTSAVPTFVDYRDKTGVARTPPTTPLHVGGGVYAYTPSDADELAGTVALVDCGAGAYPQRNCQPIHLGDGSNQFFAFHVEDMGGNLWAGTAPAVAFYQDKSGTPRTAPSLVAVAGAYLYALTPTLADIVAETTARIDAPAGSGWPYLLAETEPISPWVQPSPGPIKNPAADLVTFLNGKLAGSTLLASGANLFAGPMRSIDGTPAPAVFCLNTGGEVPRPYTSGDRSAYYSPSVQVMVRGPTNNIAGGEELARGVFAWLQQSTITGYTQVLVRESQPFPLGEDTSRHGQWVMNVSCQYPATLS